MSASPRTGTPEGGADVRERALLEVTALGAVTAWPSASGALTDPVVIGVLLLLNGHFVFPRYGRQGILCRMG